MEDLGEYKSSSEGTMRSFERAPADHLLLREQKKIVNMLLDCIPTPLLLLDHQTERIVFANLAADQLTGETFPRVSSLYEFPWFSVQNRPLLNADSPPVRVSRGEKLFDFQCVLYGQNGKLSVSISSASLSSLFGGQDNASILWIKNVSELREAETQLLKAKEEALAASKAKSWFLANMSHEIRTPLNAIIGFSELLEDSLNTPAERERCISSIRKNGNALTRLVTDILELSKVESKQIHLEKQLFSPRKLLKEIQDCFSLRAKDKGIALLVERDDSLPELVESDMNRCRQVIYNLVENAIKFTSSGFVKVQVKYLQEKGLLLFRIEDTGVGIPADKIQWIFEPFVQVDNSYTRRYGGSGLGLDISRRLARILGGDVELESSSITKGSVFTASFAVGYIRQDHLALFAKSETAIILGRLDGARILIVEDAPDNRMLVGKFLTMAGAIIEFAENGLEGVDKALNNEYDIILMDIQMPELDGYEATAHLRWKEYTKPIIALTAHALSEERQKCFEVGCNEHLTKPVDRALLINTVARFLNHESSSPSTIT